MCFYYNDQPKMAETRQVKCRKDHPCEGCHRKIRKGEKAEHNTGLFDGAWYSYYVCDRCQRVIMAIAVKEMLGVASGTLLGVHRAIWLSMSVTVNITMTKRSGRLDFAHWKIAAGM